MGEKIKDLIYDFSDIIISLVIITMIFGVVSWKISDSMAYSSFTDQASKATLENTQTDDGKDTTADETTTTTDTEQTDTDTAANTTETANTGGKPAASSTTPATSTTNSQPVTTTNPPAATTPATAPSEFKVEIPAGSAGITIAKILKEKGIISDTKMFITRVDQLKMGPKLKAGSYTIKAGSSLDDVIYIIAGKKK